MAYVDQKFSTLREDKYMNTCQMCGDFFRHSCETAAGYDVTIAREDFIEGNQDVFNITANIDIKPNLTTIYCSICCKSLLEPMRAYLVDGCDRTTGADPKIMSHIKRFSEGLQSYLFAFKGTTIKAPTSEAENTQRISLEFPLLMKIKTRS